MICIDVLKDVSISNHITLVDANSGVRLGLATINLPNTICSISLATHDQDPDFVNYSIVHADNYTGKRLLAFWDYGSGKTVFDIPADTGVGKYSANLDYVDMPIFTGFTFKDIQLKPGVNVFVDPTFPVISFTDETIKRIPLTPNVVAMLGIKLQEV